MRLLKSDGSGGFQLVSVDERSPPPYAILSHTWGPDEAEVTFEDIEARRGEHKSGYQKVAFCAQRAKADGLEYFWIDTCCINKSASSELNRSITSMFKWYAKSAKCYVFLSDVFTRKRESDGDAIPWEQAFRTSRWMKRGWTLQELLAPEYVEFFSCNGDLLGDRTTLALTISSVTGIPTEALSAKPVQEFSISERMKWAAGRKTKEVEDRVYSMLGILGISLVPNYGEGSEDAVARLENELARKLQREMYGVGSVLLEHDRGSSTTSKPNVSPLKPCVSPVERRNGLLESLKAASFNARRLNIKNALSKTCRWLLNHEAYTMWNNMGLLHKHHGILWIRGNPGTGKSTIMKFAHEHCEEHKGEDEVVISFFFNARGDEFEASTLGMWSGLVDQLFEKAPDLQAVLDEVEFPVRNQIETLSWTTELLCDAFTKAVLKLGHRRLRCFIDALDECNENQVRGMLEVMENVSSEAMERNIGLQVCFASRHYPTVGLEHCEEMTLEDEDGHRDDLEEYVLTRLKTKKSKAAERLRSQILQKANGVFIWVVLVIPLLNIVIEKGRMNKLEETLRAIPQKLSELFKQILTRDNDDLGDMLLCFQWILFAMRPLNKDEFYFAMMSGSAPDSKEMVERDPDVTEDDMRRFVISSSKGLAELTKSNPTVQFVHESVRDFLIKDNGLRDMWPQLDGDVSVLSHEKLKQCCLTYVNVKRDPLILATESLGHPSSEKMKIRRKELREKCPFLDYASRHILDHAERADGCMPDEDFLSSFPLASWIHITNLFALYETRRHTKNASMPYVLAENDCPRLIRKLCTDLPYVGPRGEKHHYALFAALASGHKAAAAALLNSEKLPSLDSAVNETFSIGKKQTPFRWALERGYDDIALALLPAHTPGTGVDIYSDILLLAAEGGCLEVARAVLNARPGVVNDPDAKGDTPLMKASRSGHDKIARLLLECGADLNQGTPFNTAIWQAVLNGHSNTVVLLLNHGALPPPSSSTNLGQYPNLLCFAAEHGLHDVVKILLDHGMNVDEVGEARIGSKPLIHAAIMNRHSTLKLLLHRGASANATDSVGMTALHHAAAQRHFVCVNILLRHNANVRAKDQYGRTPLFMTLDNIGRNHPVYELSKAFVMDALLDAGSSTDVLDNKLQTPLIYAVRFRASRALIKTLLSRGATTAARDTFGRTALHWAALTQSSSSVDELIVYTADIDVRDHRGYSPLLLAAGLVSPADESFHGDPLGCTLSLLRAGADFEAKAPDGRTLWSTKIGRSAFEEWTAAGGPIKRPTLKRPQTTSLEDEVSSGDGEVDGGSQTDNLSVSEESGFEDLWS